MCTGACAARHPGDRLPQLLHRRRVAEQPQRRAAAGRLDGLAELERRGDQAAQHGEVDRLGDEVERPELERPHRSLDVAVRGDHRDRRAGMVGLDPLDEVEAVAVGQAHVGQHEVVALPPSCVTRSR